MITYELEFLYQSQIIKKEQNWSKRMESDYIPGITDEDSKNYHHFKPPCENLEELKIIAEQIKTKIQQSDQTCENEYFVLKNMRIIKITTDVELFINPYKPK